MVPVTIKGVHVSPLKRILHPSGDIWHVLKKSDSSFNGFGEVYFSTILHQKIKGWKKHQEMQLNLVVPQGEVLFVIYDDRKDSLTKGQFNSFKLSPNNYQRLTVEPGLWMAFKGLGLDLSWVVNTASIEHQKEEAVNKEINAFAFDWGVYDS